MVRKKDLTDRNVNALMGVYTNHGEDSVGTSHASIGTTLQDKITSLRTGREPAFTTYKIKSAALLKAEATLKKGKETLTNALGIDSWKNTIGGLLALDARLDILADEDVAGSLDELRRFSVQVMMLLMMTAGAAAAAAAAAKEALNAMGFDNIDSADADAIAAAVNTAKERVKAALNFALRSLYQVCTSDAELAPDDAFDGDDRIQTLLKEGGDVQGPDLSPRMSTLAEEQTQNLILTKDISGVVKDFETAYKEALGIKGLYTQRRTAVDRAVNAMNGQLKAAYTTFSAGDNSFLKLIEKIPASVSAGGNDGATVNVEKKVVFEVDKESVVKALNALQAFATAHHESLPAAANLNTSLSDMIKSLEDATEGNTTVTGVEGAENKTNQENLQEALGQLRIIQGILKENVVTLKDDVEAFSATLGNSGHPEDNCRAIAEAMKVLSELSFSKADAVANDVVVADDALEAPVANDPVPDANAVANEVVVANDDVVANFIVHNPEYFEAKKGRWKEDIKSRSSNVASMKEELKKTRRHIIARCGGDKPPGFFLPNGTNGYKTELLTNQTKAELQDRLTSLSGELDALTMQVGQTLDEQLEVFQSLLRIYDNAISVIESIEASVVPEAVAVAVANAVANDAVVVAVPEIQVDTVALQQAVREAKDNVLAEAIVCPPDKVSEELKVASKAYNTALQKQQSALQKQQSDSEQPVYDRAAGGPVEKLLEAANKYGLAAAGGDPDATAKAALIEAVTQYQTATQEAAENVFKAAVAYNIADQDGQDGAFEDVKAAAKTVYGLARNSTTTVYGDASMNPTYSKAPGELQTLSEAATEYGLAAAGDDKTAISKAEAKLLTAVKKYNQAMANDTIYDNADASASNISVLIDIAGFNEAFQTLIETPESVTNDDLVGIERAIGQINTQLEALTGDVKNVPPEEGIFTEPFDSCTV